MRHQKRRGFLFGLFAVILAVVTGLLFTSRLAALERQIGERQRVVVAKQNIDPRQLITADMLEVRDIPRMFAHPSYVQSIEDVANQRIAVVPLQQGMIIRQTDVAPTNGLEAGWRAVSIAVNPVAVLADRVNAGSRVDVVVSYETTFIDAQGEQVSEKRTRTVLSDVEVLGVAGAPRTQAQVQAPNASAQAQGGFFGAQPQTSPLTPSTGYELRDSTVIATLKVRPEDAQQLAYMDTYATDIRLALRRPDDRAIEPLPPISEEDFR